MRTLARDPFARVETVRRTVYARPGSLLTCDNCGQAKTTKTGRPFLYQYGTYKDGIRTRPQFPADRDRRSFCSASCHRSYYCL